MPMLKAIKFPGIGPATVTITDGNGTPSHAPLDLLAYTRKVWVEPKETQRPG